MAGCLKRLCKLTCKLVNLFTNFANAYIIVLCAQNYKKQVKNLSAQSFGS